MVPWAIGAALLASIFAMPDGNGVDDSDPPPLPEHATSSTANKKEITLCLINLIGPSSLRCQAPELPTRVYGRQHTF
jgi:hypothetical protein